MSIFYFHPQNAVPKKLAEMTGVRGFTYTNRNELDLKLQRLITEMGGYIDPRFHTVIGSLAGAINYHLPLDPDNELDRHTLKVCEQKSPWSYIKVLNGRDSMYIMGYVSAGGNSPFAMTTTEMAQKGLISVGYVPRPV